MPLDREIDGLPRRAAVLRAEHGGLARPFGKIGAAREVDSLGVARVERKAEDGVDVVVRAVDAVVQRDPRTMLGEPAVGAAHIGARVEQSRFAGVKLDPGHVAAAAEGDVAPGVGFDGGAGGGQRKWGGDQNDACEEQRWQEGEAGGSIHGGERKGGKNRVALQDLTLHHSFRSPKTATL